MKSLNVYLFAICTVSSVGAVQIYAENQNPPVVCENVRVSERDVARSFFQESIAWQRPVIYGTDWLAVNISLFVSAINEIDERRKLLKIHGFLSLSWLDQFHQWHHSFPHNCINYVVLPPTAKVWIPDLSQLLSEEKNSFSSDPAERVRIDNTGLASYSPGGVITAICEERKLAYFPFDYQKCTVRVESWKYTRDHLRLVISDPPILIGQWIDNELWHLVSTSHSYKHVYYTSSRSYDRVEFVFVLKRKAGFYVGTIVIPNFLLSLAALSIFSLPLVEIARLYIAFTCLLAHAIFQLLLLASDMPRSSDHYPLLSVIIDLQLVYTGILIAGQSFIYLFMYWSDPSTYCDIEDGCPIVDNTKLEKSLSIPLKFYNSWCMLGKLFRIQPPYSMVFSSPKQKKRVIPSPSMFAKLSGADSNPGNYQNDERNSRSRFLSFFTSCPAVPFSSPQNNGSPAATNEIESRTNRDLEQPESRSFIDSSKHNLCEVASNSGSSAKIGPSSLPSTPAVISSATTRMLLDFRRRLWRFYAKVVDRLTLLIYMVCIVLTPICILIASAKDFAK